MPKLLDDLLQSVKQFVDGDKLNYTAEELDVEAVVTESRLVRQRIGLAHVQPPDIIWLPSEYYAKFDGADGISDRGLRCRGSSALLAAEEYYREIVWHETLHLCFCCAD